MNWGDRIKIPVFLGLGAIALRLISSILISIFQSFGLIGMLIAFLFQLVNWVSIIAVPLAVLVLIILIIDGIIESLTVSSVHKFIAWGCVLSLACGGIGTWVESQLGLNFKSFWDAFDTFLHYLGEFNYMNAFASLFALFPEHAFICSGILFLLFVLGIFFGENSAYKTLSCIIGIGASIFYLSSLIGVIVLFVLGLIAVGICCLLAGLLSPNTIIIRTHEDD